METSAFVARVRHRNLAAGGFVDPTLTERTGLPLVAAFGAGELLEMRGWRHRNPWIGRGLVSSPHGPRDRPPRGPRVRGFRGR